MKVNYQKYNKLLDQHAIMFNDKHIYIYTSLSLSLSVCVRNIKYI